METYSVAITKSLASKTRKLANGRMLLRGAAGNVFQTSTARNAGKPNPDGNAGAMIPQELIDIIMNYFRDDVDALKRCSLVCRRWGHSSSALLFYRFHFPPCSPSGKPCDPFNLDGKRCFQACVKMLRGSDRIRFAVRDLSLRAHTCALRHKMPDSERGLHLTQDILASIVGLIPDIRSLRLSHCDLLPRASFLITSSWLSSEQNLDTLEVEHYQNDLHPVVVFLLSITHVRKLAIRWHPPLLATAVQPQIPTVEAWSREPSTRTRLTVNTLDLSIGSGWLRESALLHLMNHILDLQSLRSLALNSPLTPLLISLLTPLTNIEQLAYVIADEQNPASLAQSFRLRELSLVTHIIALRATNLCWRGLLRDLNKFACPETQFISVKMTIQHLRSPSEPPEQHALKHCLVTGFDWLAFEEIIGKYPALDFFTIYVSCRWGETVVSPQHAVQLLHQALFYNVTPVTRTKIRIVGERRFDYGSPLRSI